MSIAERQAVLMRRFMAWLLTLDETQLAAFTENWGNVMDDAALDRIDSWVIADATIANLRKSRGETP